jgi:hypothetical protein
MKTKELPIFRSIEARKVVGQACKKHGITETLLKELIELQRKYTGERQIGISSEFDSVLSDYIDQKKSEA